MYALLFSLFFGQCGPGGCAIPPQGQPMVTDRTVWQQAIFDLELVPPEAQLWFDDSAVQVVNGKAYVRTPPLEPGRRYRYRVTARWGDVERAWTLSFSPGQTVRVALRRDEPAPSTAPGDADGSASSDGLEHAFRPEGQLPVVEQDGVQNFGIDRSGLNGSAERITLDGREITRSEAAQILQAGSLHDDSGKLRLTVIGTEADRRRVLDDLKSRLADIASQCLVQDYSPDHWAVARAGFYTAGKPTIYVQAPDGKVLHRQDDYTDGAEGLRLAFEQLRKPDPDYRPDKDPDLRRPVRGLLSRVFEILMYPFRVILSWLLAAGVAFILVVLVMKGWLFYLFGLLASLVPGPPKTTPKPQSQGSKTRTPRRSSTKSRARR